VICTFGDFHFTARHCMVGTARRKKVAFQRFNRLHRKLNFRRRHDKHIFNRMTASGLECFVMRTAPLFPGMRKCRDIQIINNNKSFAIVTRRTRYYFRWRWIRRTPSREFSSVETIRRTRSTSFSSPAVRETKTGPSTPPRYFAFARSNLRHRLHRQSSNSS